MDGCLSICFTVRSEINRCRENIKKAAEELNEEKIKLESKVVTYTACSLSLEKVFSLDFWRILYCLTNCPSIIIVVFLIGSVLPCQLV